MESSSTFKINPENQYEEIFTPELKDFLIQLHEKFNGTRLELLENRKQVQKDFDNGILPTFPKETEEIRNSDWVCAPFQNDIQDRRVEITGPVDR